MQAGTALLPYQDYLQISLFTDTTSPTNCYNQRVQAPRSCQFGSPNTDIPTAAARDLKRALALQSIIHHFTAASSNPFDLPPSASAAAPSA